MGQYKYVVGIDLGTTNTLACYFAGNKKKLVKFGGKPMLPSVVYIGDKEKIYVGWVAENKGKVDPRNLIRSSKRYIGDNESNEVWECHGRKFNPVDAATEILKEVRRQFIKQVGCDQEEEIGAVITVPAYFNNNRREATRQAGEDAGFRVMWTLEEPTAAAIEAVRDKQLDKKVLVVDIGGGTFDLSVLEADHEKHTYDTCDVDGDPRLGGDDFDDALVDRFMELLEDDTGINFASPQAAGMEEGEFYKLKNDLRKLAREVKKELSSGTEYDVEEANLFQINGRNYDFKMHISRDTFNQLCDGIYECIFSRMDRFLNRNKHFRRDEIGNVVLAGGSCYIPYIQQRIESMLKKKPHTDLDFSLLVAYGAARVAESKNGGGVAGDAPIIPRSIVVHSLGVEMLDEENHESVLSKILERGRKYPCANSKEYTTTDDNQTEIRVNVYEAGNDNEDKSGIQYHKLYGSLVLDGIAPEPKGKAKIEVTFDYDENQRLTVTVKNEKTGKTETKKINRGERVEIAPREKPVDLMLMLDASGSMRGQDMVDAQDASCRLVEEMIDLTVHRMGLIYFNDSPVMLCGLTHNQDGELQRGIESISAGGGTNMRDALRLAYRELEDSPNERVALLVTDGLPAMREQTLQVAQNLRASGLTLVAIGVGEGADLAYLQQMVGVEHAYTIETMAQLTEMFKRVMQSITQLH